MRKKEVIQKTINVSDILPCKGQRLSELISGRECCNINAGTTLLLKAIIN